MSVGGGTPIALYDGGFFYGASWGSDDTIVFEDASRLWRISADGGEREALTSGEVAARWPHILPGGTALLYTLWRGSAVTAEIAVLSLETSESRTLTGGSQPRYLPTGHMVFGRERSVWAVPFDIDQMEVTGPAVPVVENVPANPYGGAVNFAVSRAGSLAYVPTGEAVRRLVWVDRNGREEPLAAPPRDYVLPRISPDGTRVALQVRDEENDIWLWDFAQETLTRLTFGPASDRFPVWTPDGQRVAFTSTREGGVENLFWKAADGTGTVERLTESQYYQESHSFTPDGRRLVFRVDHPDSGMDFEVLSMDGERQVEPLLATEFGELNPELSPDGRWLAYDSDASGQVEVYVRPFPNVNDGRWHISPGGGTHPVWGPDGRQVFYRAEGNVMGVTVQAEPSFTAGNPEVIIAWASGIGENSRAYDVSPDGQRFLMIKEAEGAAAPSQIHLILNWFTELERLVPTP